MEYTDFYKPLADYLGLSVDSLLTLLFIAAIWSLVWKGIALWRSARKRQPVWFIVLLATNTLGIFEILYIFIFSRMSFKDNTKKEVKNAKSKKSTKRK